jgi:CBS domain-containing protein
MSRHEAKPRSIHELIQALQAARDSARVRLHLLSLEAKDRFRELEDKLSALEAKLQAGGEKAAAGASATVDELTHAMIELFHTAGWPLTIQVQELMRRDPVSCWATDSISRAAQIMWEHDCGTVPVVDSEGKVIGIITDRDICMATYTRGQPPVAITVEATMSKDVRVVSPADSLEDVTRLMSEHQVRRLPVTEGGRLVGMFAVADLARYIGTSQGNNLPLCLTLAHVLSAISEDRQETKARVAAE